MVWFSGSGGFSISLDEPSLRKPNGSFEFYLPCALVSSEMWYRWAEERWEEPDHSRWEKWPLNRAVGVLKNLSFLALFKLKALEPGLSFSLVTFSPPPHPVPQIRRMLSRRQRNQSSYLNCLQIPNNGSDSRCIRFSILFLKGTPRNGLRVI